MNDRVMKVFDTDKENYKVMIVKPWQGSLYRVAVSQGSLHKHLQGHFTSIGDAERRIKEYFRSHYKVPNISKNRENKVEEKLQTQEGNFVGD